MLGPVHADAADLDGLVRQEVWEDVQHAPGAGVRRPEVEAEGLAPAERPNIDVCEEIQLKRVVARDGVPTLDAVRLMNIGRPDPSRPTRKNTPPLS